MLKFDVISLEPEKNENRKWCKIFGVQYIYIFIAFALDESGILDVLQFPMKNIYQSCDPGHAIGWSNVNASL